MLPKKNSFFKIKWIQVNEKCIANAYILPAKHRKINPQTRPLFDTDIQIAILFILENKFQAIVCFVYMSETNNAINFSCKLVVHSMATCQI